MHYTISIKVDELRSMIIYDELDSCSICPFHKLCQKIIGMSAGLRT